MVSSPDAIRNLLSTFEKAAETLEDQIVDITYFTKGISWEEAWQLSYLTREKILKNIKRRLKEESGDKAEDL